MVGTGSAGARHLALRKARELWKGLAVLRSLSGGGRALRDVAIRLLGVRRCLLELIGQLLLGVRRQLVQLLAEIAQSLGRLRIVAVQQRVAHVVGRRVILQRGGQRIQRLLRGK